MECGVNRWLISTADVEIEGGDKRRTNSGVVARASYLKLFANVAVVIWGVKSQGWYAHILEDEMTRAGPALIVCLPGAKSAAVDDVTCVREIVEWRVKRPFVIGCSMTIDSPWSICLLEWLRERRRWRHGSPEIQTITFWSIERRATVNVMGERVQRKGNPVWVLTELAAGSRVDESYASGRIDVGVGSDETTRPEPFVGGSLVPSESCEIGMRERGEGRMWSR
ncbi:hypothetical protein C8F01DRAFT_1086879 [Mycena amicta]|nr:hypothetical protein C8F01DRAFT_1086879 [Mycena amicta]